MRNNIVQPIFLLCVSLTCAVHSPCSGTGLSDVAKIYPACHHFTSLHFRDADNVAIWLIHDFRKYYSAFNFNFLRKNIPLLTEHRSCQIYLPWGHAARYIDISSSMTSEKVYNWALCSIKWIQSDSLQPIFFKGISCVYSTPLRYLS